jgi:diadenosine tetraphosphate (Ap4A) HIT family hydrolase
MSECVTCELVRRRDRGEAPPWDRIGRTAYWDVVHAFGTAVEGWMVLVVRRHITAVAEMSDEEAIELGPLVKEVSRAAQQVLGCAKTYVVQFAEHRNHPHVHVHVIPRAADLPDEHQGPRIFGLLGVPDDQAVSEMRMNQLAEQLRADLRIS